MPRAGCRPGPAGLPPAPWATPCEQDPPPSTGKEPTPQPGGARKFCRPLTTPKTCFQLHPSNFLWPLQEQVQSLAPMQRSFSDPQPRPQPGRAQKASEPLGESVLGPSCGSGTPRAECLPTPLSAWGVGGAQRCCWLVLASPLTVTQALIGVWWVIHYLSWKATDSQGKDSVPFLETGHAGPGATGDGGAAERAPGASAPRVGVRAARVHSTSQLRKHVAHCGTSQLPFAQGETEAQSWRGAWLAQP